SAGCKVSGRGKLPSGVGWKDATRTRGVDFAPARLEFDDLAVEVLGVAVKDITTYTALKSVDKEYRELRIEARTVNTGTMAIYTRGWVQRAVVRLNDGTEINWRRRSLHGKTAAGGSSPVRLDRKLTKEQWPVALEVLGKTIAFAGPPSR
ncbi:MAG: hypothetical protein ACYTGX_19515, partial [Planctomycetota bacterium]